MKSLIHILIHLIHKLIHLFHGSCEDDRKEGKKDNEA